MYTFGGLKNSAAKLSMSLRKAQVPEDLHFRGSSSRALKFGALPRVPLKGSTIRVVQGLGFRVPLKGSIRVLKRDLL